MQQAQTLSSHKVDIQALGVVGLASFGNAGIELTYCCEPADRKALLSGDVHLLCGAGYRARIVGRNRMVAIDLKNVGDAMNARYVK